MIRIFSYSRESKRMETPSILELPRHLADRGRMIWADLEDPTDEETGVLGGMFGFHVLAVEDCMQEGLLPKFNLYDGYIFNIVHAAESKNTEAFSTTEVDIFVGESFFAEKLTKIQGRFTGLDIGSYPFSRDGKYGATIVIRSADKSKLDDCEKEIHNLIKEY